MKKTYQLDNLTFDYSRVRNTEAWRTKEPKSARVIGYAKDGMVTLQNGDTYPINTTETGIVKGYLWDQIMEYYQVMGATYKGKPLVISRDFGTAQILDNIGPMDMNYYISGVYQAPTNVRFKVDGIKREYTTIYDSTQHVVRMMILTGFIQIPSDGFYQFKPKTEYSEYKSHLINYAGGGYGETYYVSQVKHESLDVIKKWLDNQYLHPEFIAHVANLPEEVDFCYSERSPTLDAFYNTSNWNVEVEYIQYEGYYPDYYRLSSYAVKEINQAIEARIASYTGVKMLDWKQLKP